MFSISDIIITDKGIEFSLLLNFKAKKNQRIVFDLYPNNAPSHPKLSLIHI